MDSAAFELDAPVELARMLRELADKMESTWDMDHALKDVNGNTVGKSELWK
jgi:hypothetical protein